MAAISCIHCGYDLSGLPLGISGRSCPECGRMSPELRPPHSLLTRRRFGAWLVAAALCSVATFGVAIGADNGLDGISYAAGVVLGSALLCGAVAATLFATDQSLSAVGWPRKLSVVVCVAILTSIMCGIAAYVGAMMNSGRAV
jgi:hypothetical protein